MTEAQARELRVGDRVVRTLNPVQPNRRKLGPLRSVGTVTEVDGDFPIRIKYDGPCGYSLRAYYDMADIERLEE